MTIINETLQQYIDAIDSGFGFIGGDVRWVFNILVLLNIVVAALFWAFSDDQVIVQLVRKVIYVGIFAWIIDNWVELTNILAETFMQLGLKAGGGQIERDLILNPGNIADRGLTTVTPILQAIRDLTGPVAFFENIAEILLLTLAVLAIIIAFFLIAIQAVMAILTFKLGTLAAFVLVPFSLITHTAFMAERPLGWVVSASVRLMLLTLVVGLGEALFARLEIAADQLTIRAALDIALGAIVLMVLSITATRLANDLATGTPRLGAMDAAIGIGGVALASTYITRKAYAASRAGASGARLAASKAASSVQRVAKTIRNSTGKTQETK